MQDKVVVSLGRFSWEKGFDLLLDAWAELADRFPDWSLHLYGDGPDEDDLRQRCQELGLTSVSFRGRTADVARCSRPRLDLRAWPRGTKECRSC